MLKALKKRNFRQKMAAFFDAEYYLRLNPDVAAADMDPLQHYLDHGWREGRNPSADFDNRYYLDTYPDVASSDANPLVHFVEHGRFENRLTHPTRPSQTVPAPPSIDLESRDAQYALLSANMDQQFYLATYHDVADAGMDPVEHYLDFGWNEGRNPNANFCTAFYLEEYPDVRRSKLHPFVHYLSFGRFEGRLASSPILDRIALKPVESPWKKPGLLKHAYELSVVIPTYNRAHMLPALLESWRATHARTRFSYEIIFSDDGSDDDTLSILEAATDLPITLVRNDHGGAAKARNAAVRAASGEKVLFLGDDIFPDPWLINRHVEKHKQLPDTDAVLGFCDWHPALNVNYLMQHITEIGCEQFSFLHFPVHGYTDFRHFYTCNISIDREFLLSESVIFDEAFYKVNFEDIELGYRLAQKGMRIYYYPEAYGDHYHPYNDVGRFCMRQAIAGEMAIVFQKLHPEVAHLIPLRAIEERWAPYIGDGPAMFDFFGAIVALCQQAEDRHDELDSAAKADLSQVYGMLFRFAFEDGYCRHRLVGVTADVSNRIFHAEFFDAARRKALAGFARSLDLAGYDEVAQALAKVVPFEPRREAPVVPIVQPVVAPAAVAKPATAAAATLARNDAIPAPLLTVVGEDWVHLNSLMEAYAAYAGQVQFALASEAILDGMVYAPRSGDEMSATTLGEVLLFIELNPEVGKVVLSHGLHDLPRIGFRKGGTVDLVERRKDVSRGKVIRIFGGEETQTCTLESFFGARLKGSDVHGYLQF